MNGYIQEVDNAIGFLTSELAKRSLDTHAHIVVVSDECTMYDEIIDSQTIGQRSWYVIYW